jgi:hypothetical protein
MPFVVVVESGPLALAESDDFSSDLGRGGLGDQLVAQCGGVEWIIIASLRIASLRIAARYPGTGSGDGC